LWFRLSSQSWALKVLSVFAHILDETDRFSLQAEAGQPVNSLSTQWDEPGKISCVTHSQVGLPALLYPTELG
jgi:hypothetical protein